MDKRRVKIAGLACCLLFLAACSPSEPNEAAGAKVLRNIFARGNVPADVVSFKKTMGRAVPTKQGEVYEYWYESEVHFPQEFEAKCSSEKERGVCALLGLVADQTFKKNEILKSEGSLHFSKTDKGWLAEDKNTY